MKEKTLFIIMIVIICVMGVYIMKQQVELDEVKKTVAEKQAFIDKTEKEIDEAVALVKKYTCIRNPFK
ncbi:hypothetical protein [Beggiatoa leptomitoformis]|uniref:Uncharacterized protein n=1 Tax=Beggiatoa leptomitoformis TaxID=288004 RepID=A0A2N9YBM3_9GAMM|nr:hypothetical protein [Beggiatoa leptomitoformis]ALG66767.1 hypothetical protein AL038_02370 [Beggiatoa leptomitoformis]AUI67888.1 hypothetical protein BLE401_03670 [Beggiatoa leptomitoformis]